MKFLFPLFLFFVLLPPMAGAVNAPAGQALIDASHVLRGRFLEEHQMGMNNPIQSAGHFTVAPGHGLIWGIEKPFPTSTIITRQAVVQDLGGLTMKLPAKNLRHLYDMVGGALAGDWSALANDFDITPGSAGGRWTMLLTPRQNGTLPYSTITVSGGQFVENIIMAKANGNSDSFSFSDAILSPAQLSAQESAAFNKVRN